MSRINVMVLSLLTFCHSLPAADVVVLVNTKCPLAKDAKVEPFRCPTLGAENVPIVRGDQAGKAGLKEAGYIIELAPPTGVPVPSNLQATLEGEVNSRRIDYVQVHMLQTFKIWHVNKAGAAPDALGEGFIVRQSSPIKTISGTKIRITKKEPPELIRDGMLEMPEAVAGQIENSLAHRVVVGKFVRDTRQRAASVLNSPTAMAILHMGDLPHFFPSKIVRNADGTIAAEVPLHNRLPGRVTGTLKATAIFSIAGMPLKESVDFDLKAGEKRVVRMPVVIPESLKGGEWTVVVSNLKVLD